MEEKSGKYLPLGSVCLLNGGERYVVVIGYLGMSKENADTVYDYLGAVYPLGVISSDVSFMFNHDQIKQVVFRGFEDEEGRAFNEKLNTVVKEQLLEQMKREGKENDWNGKWKERMD